MVLFDPNFLNDTQDKLKEVIQAELSIPGNSYTLQLVYEVFLSVDNYTSELSELLPLYAAIKAEFTKYQLYQFMYELDTHTLGSHNFVVGDNIPTLTDVVQQPKQRLH